MPDNGSGVFVRLYSWVADAAAGIKISSTKFDADENDVAQAITNRLCRDGQDSPTADISWGGHKITSLKPGAAPGEAATYEQIGSGSNRLDNATFAVNQRALTGSQGLGANAYGLDRWKAGTSGCTFSFDGGVPDVTVTISTGSLKQIIAAESIEAGTFTISNQGTAQARVYQGSVASAYQTCPAQVVLAAGSPVIVEFGPGTVLRPQLELGSVAKSFGRRPFASELANCQRFYEVGTRVFEMRADTNGIWIDQVQMKVVKSAAPTITLTNVDVANNTTSHSIPSIYLHPDAFAVTFFTNNSTNALVVPYTWAASSEP